MAVEVRGTACCGVKEISPISEQDTPEEVLKDILTFRRWDHRTGQYVETGYRPPRCAYITFTQASNRRAPATYGDRLMAYIHASKLGKVVAVGSAQNPNTRNMITHYTWRPNKAGLKRWYESRAGGR